MPPAARATDPTGHPGLISGPGAANVLIGSLPAARVGDLHACTFPPPTGPHPPNPITKGSATVLIGGHPAARAGDITGCGAAILVGLPTVQIGG
jgi:uncharacterized Zn-binding protein involved in type VI secretion